jgi:hypothetical protein
MPEELQTIAEDLAALPNLAPLYLPTNDPRPDLTGDSVIWGRLLSLAHGTCGEDQDSLFWVLNGLRCLGTLLVKGAFGWKLEAGQNKTYAADRARYLLPNKDKLLELLGRL